MGRCDRVACDALYRLGHCIVSNRKVIYRIASARIQIGSGYCLAVSVRSCDREADVILYISKRLISVYCLGQSQAACLLCIGIDKVYLCILFCLYSCSCYFTGFFASTSNRIFSRMLKSCNIRYCLGYRILTRHKTSKGLCSGCCIQVFALYGCTVASRSFYFKAQTILNISKCLISTYCLCQSQAATHICRIIETDHFRNSITY